MARRKLGCDWAEVRDILETLRALCPVRPLTVEVHDLGLRLAEPYGLSIYDAMIAASALDCGCNTLSSAGFQDGQILDGRLRVRTRPSPAPVVPEPWLGDKGGSRPGPVPMPRRARIVGAGDPMHADELGSELPERLRDRTNGGFVVVDRDWSGRLPPWLAGALGRLAGPTAQGNRRRRANGIGLLGYVLCRGLHSRRAPSMIASWGLPSVEPHVSGAQPTRSFHRATHAYWSRVKPRCRARPTPA
ncbi:MAG: PIN domain-containing protein [Rhodospirillales bacterium]|nr:PIN domain-containing protein [Rhodospirillales bacterium]